MTRQDFQKMKFYRDQYEVEHINLEDIELKSASIFNARTYIYKKGEAEKIANRKFDRALKEGTLAQFPNVTFF